LDSLGFDLSVTEELAEEEVEGLSLLPCDDVVRPVVVVVDVVLAVEVLFIFLV